MCGICGVVGHREMVIDRHLLENMTDVIKHRGPDRGGFHTEPGIGLGFRRLSIIDLSTGDQPMFSADGSIAIVFNGEIYNFQELRSALEAQGDTFRTRSDTEVIIHAYEKYGLDFIAHLHGMFAFALWDRNQRRLIMARDRVGKKPLFYHHAQGRLIFASEMKAILEDRQIPRTVTPKAIDHYLTYRYVPGDETILAEIRRLPPAHRLIYYPDDDTLRVERYWSPLDHEARSPVSDEELDHLIREAVRLRMISDVPLGAFLSGGLDSSIIVALMASFSDRPIKTFSIGFGEDRYNELPYARLVAERYKTEHYEYIVKPEIETVLDKLVWYLDEPMGDSSALPSYYVSQMARQEVTVALNGDGGDESFAGYPRFGTMLRTLKYAALPGGIRRHLLEPVFARLPDSRLTRRIHHLSDYSRHPLAIQYAIHIYLMSAAQRMTLYQGDVAEQLVSSTDQYIVDMFCQSNGFSPLAQMTLTDIQCSLPGDLLVKMDRMSMAHSLEARSPFLDHRIIEASLTLPDSARLNWHSPNKIVLRRLYHHLLPEAILKRRKSGFRIPVDEWFRGPLLNLTREVLLNAPAQQRAYFNPAAVRQLIDDHAAGRRNAGDILWELVVLELWLSKFIDGVSTARN